MPANWISYGQPVLGPTTLTSLTLGSGPGQTAPPEFLLWNGASGGTITLPPINPSLPVPPGTPSTTPGVGDGFTITFKNVSGQPLTLTPAGSDTIDTYYISAASNIITLRASTANKNWYNMTGLGAGNTRSVAGAATIATTDRYLIISAAAAVTLPAPSNFPVDAPFVTVINTSSGNVTVTPASGNIDGLAALTIATVKEATLLCDGTNFFVVAG